MSKSSSINPFVIYHNFMSEFGEIHSPAHRSSLELHRPSLWAVLEGQGWCHSHISYFGAPLCGLSLSLTRHQIID